MIIDMTWYAEAWTDGAFEKFTPSAFDSLIGSSVIVTQGGQEFNGTLKSAEVSEDGTRVDLKIEVPNEAIPSAMLDIPYQAHF
jgi:hypothetical protein